MSAQYDAHTDAVVRTAWEAIRAWRAGRNICNMLPWIDASNEEKAGFYATVVKSMTELQRSGNISMSVEPSDEEILVINIIFALANER